MPDDTKNLLPEQAVPTPERGSASGPDIAPDTRAPADPAPPDPLEAYFERLDSAFASIGHKNSRSPLRPLDRPSGEEPAPPEAPGHSEPVHTHLATAFAALLAAEQGLVPPQPGALVHPAVIIPDEVIERIVERVLARLAEDPLRRNTS